MALLLTLPALARAEDYGCLEGVYNSCLQDGRFKVRASVSYTDSADGEYRTKGARIREALVGDAASLFYFFTFDNPELMVKVVDGCAVNGRFWVFGSAATDLHYTVKVTDVATGQESVYRSVELPTGIGDVVSFPCRIPEGVAAGASENGESSGPAGLLDEEDAPWAGGALPAGVPLCGVGDGPHLPDLTEEALHAEPPSASVAVRRASTDKVHVIDIAFLYAGSIADTAKLRKNVDDAVAWANVAFLRSGVPAALRTVAVQPDRRYGVYLDGVTPGEAMSSSSVWEALDEVRDEYGADLLYALTVSRDPSACGVATLRGRGESAKRAASAAVGAIYNGMDNDGCLRAGGLLAHEVGHNLGLTHNIENTTFTPFRDNGRGFLGKNVDGKIYGTIMHPKVKGRRFSVHPAHYQGLPMGNETANASDALLYTIEDASNYSPTKVRDPAPDYECAANSTRACMQSGRFGVEARVSYVDPSGVQVNDAEAGTRDVLLGDTASLFHFFDESNPELLVKVLDGCGVNGKYWVFGSAATDLDYSVLVTDNATGVTLPYHRNGANPLINDVAAFPCHP